MRAWKIVIAVLGSALLAGCTFPLTEELKKACAAAPDPAACAKEKFMAVQAEERERMFRSGGGV